MLKDLRPHQEIRPCKVQLSQILGVVHVEHPNIYIRRPANPIVVGFIQDVDLLLAQEQMDDAEQGSVEPMVVDEPIGEDVACQYGDDDEVETFGVHGSEISRLLVILGRSRISTS